jgi:hypothetical protein
LCEIKKVTTSRDDKKERVVERRGQLLDERVVAEPRHFFKSNFDWAKFSRLYGTLFGTVSRRN